MNIHVSILPKLLLLALKDFLTCRDLQPKSLSHGLPHSIEVFRSSTVQYNEILNIMQARMCRSQSKK